MSQQKNKKQSSPWLQCDKCSSFVVNKDIELHSNKSCPSDVKAQELVHPYVKDGTLYSQTDIKSNDEIKGLSTNCRDNSVFLSQAVIQLCSLSIGGKVVISPLNNEQVPFTKTVWPTTEKSLTSVLLTKNCLNLNLGTANCAVTVKKLPLNIQDARIVSVVLLNGPKSLEFTKELSTRLRNCHLEQFFTTGNKLSIMFYGKILHFIIKSIVEETGSIEDKLGQLSLEKSNEFFFAISEKTQFVLYKDDEEFEKTLIETDPLSKIGGLSMEIEEILDNMNNCLGKTNKKIKFIKSHSVLLYGNSGTGKTLLANSLAKESKAHIVSICAPDLYSKYTANIEEIVKNLFQEATENAPTVIILDEIDVLCPVRSNRLTDTDRRIASTLLVNLDNLHELNAKVFIIATTNKPDSIDPAFRRCGRLDREIEIPTPSPKARKEILLKLLREVDFNLNNEELSEISLNTHGFVGADLVSLCSRAAIHAGKRDDSKLIFDDFKSALKLVRPSAMREVQIEVPNVKWSDIGGQESLKLILRQAVEWPLKYAESFVRLGVTPPRGVLMFGPPGCSKTMIAKALATESGLNFLSIKGPELFSKWVGESERAVREVFRKARQVAPSIVFFDEIDALGGERTSGSSTSVQERVLAQLLTELDGVTPLGDVTILAATNRPDRIDKALLRPGRLDRIVYVPLPDDSTRREIFRIKLSKMPVVNVNIDDLVEATTGYSGAEVNAICHEAAMVALEESLDAQHVEYKHFEKALRLITPRTPQTLLKLYEDYLETKI